MEKTAMHARWGIGLLLVLTSVAVSAAVAPRHLAQTEQQREHESDNPGARAQAMDEWYNETYAQRAAALQRRGLKKPLFTPAYERFLMQAARRERTRYRSKLPASGTSAAMMNPDAALAATGPSWINIGPTKANYAKNGGTLNVTDSGRVNAIVTDPANPGTIYVAFSGGGVWKSTDHGAFWQAKTETLGSLSVGALEMDPANANTLYLGLGDPFDGTGIGLVKSTDGANTWSNPVILGTSTVIADIMVAPADSNVVLVGTNQGLYRSTDAGTSFTNIPITTASGGVPVIWTLASGGGNNIVLSLEAGTNDGEIWRSTDNGATWTRSTGVTAPSGIGRISLASAPSNKTIMYATAAAPDGSSSLDLANIFKSTDDGVTWSGVAIASGTTFKTYTNTNGESPRLDSLLRGQGWYNHMTMVDPTDPNVAYFGGALLMAKTADGGVTFSQATNWLAQFGLPYVHADFHAGHIASDGTLYVGTDGGIFASSDNGAHFTDTLNEGIASHLVYQVGSSPANPDAVIVGLQDNGTRVRVSNTSVFNQQIGGDGFGSDINRSNANLMLGSLYYDRIQKSTTAGLSFSSACSGITECNNTSSAPFVTVLYAWPGDATGNTVYTFSNTKVYKTVNYATAWTALGVAGLPSGLYIRGVTAAPSNSNVLGIVTNGGRVFLSSNGGVSWALAAGALPNNSLSMSWVAFDPTDSNIVYAASVAPVQSATHLWKSTNFGASWSAIDSLAAGFPAGIPVNSLIVDPVSHNTLYAATHLGVYASFDGGATWTRYGVGMPLVNVKGLYVSSNDSIVRAATYGRSVWELLPPNQPPVADFTATVTGMTVAFLDASTDADGTVASRSWDFGDGSPASTATSPSHTYAAGGTYSVTLTVTDNGGDTGTVTKTVTISEPVQTYSSLGTPSAIPDPGTLLSPITVSGRGGNGLAATQVHVDITHPYRGDLKIILVAPDSSQYLLKTSRGSDSADNVLATYTVDLSSEALNGTWNLKVQDVSPRDAGTLNAWSIRF